MARHLPRLYEEFILPSRKVKKMSTTATTYPFPTIEIPPELLDCTIEHVELKKNDSIKEHIQLKGIDALSLAKTDTCQREHTRVEQGDIKARFIIGVRPKRFGPFTRALPCQIVNISMGGVCIETTEDLYRDDTIVLYFSYQGAEQTEEVPIVGKVVRTSRFRRPLFQYGIQFSETIPQGDLRTIICRKAIEKKVGHDPANSN